MYLTLIKNPDESKRGVYHIARVIYAETGGASLRVAEALASMIANAATVGGRTPYDVASDANMFESLNPQSVRHKMLTVSANDCRFQMCLRVTERMLRGGLDDACFGAISFHRDDQMPAWATARGYIADIDGLLFYL